jgi:hypothetical protein
MDQLDEVTRNDFNIERDLLAYQSLLGRGFTELLGTLVQSAFHTPRQSRRDTTLPKQEGSLDLEAAAAVGTFTDTTRTV